MFESIAEAELKLSRLLSTRFSELKRQIKSNIRAEVVKETELRLQSTAEDKELSQLITQIVNIQAVEEIYLF